MSADSLTESPPKARAEAPWITRLFGRFWRLFRVKRSYSIGLEYRPKASKNPIKVGVELDYSKYFWDWSIGRKPVRATTFGGALSMAGDALAVGIVTEVKALENRFLKSELGPMERVLTCNLSERLVWLDVEITGLRLFQYGTAAVEEKKK